MVLGDPRVVTTPASVIRNTAPPKLAPYKLPSDPWIKAVTPEFNGSPPIVLRLRVCAGHKSAVAVKQNASARIMGNIIVT